eukprot:EST48687.1 Hypothetical protein SS50377_11300 [Spironucleus salmonicida]
MYVKQVLQLKLQRTYFPDITFELQTIQSSILKIFPYCVQQKLQTVLIDNNSTEQILGFKSQNAVTDTLLIQQLYSNINLIQNLQQAQNVLVNLQFVADHVPDILKTKLEVLTHDVLLQILLEFILNIPYQFFDLLSLVSTRCYLVVNYIKANSQNQNLKFKLYCNQYTTEEQQLISHIYYGLYMFKGNLQHALKCVMFYNNQNPKLNFISPFEVRELSCLELSKQALSLIQTSNPEVFIHSQIFKFLVPKTLNLDFISKIIDSIWINNYIWGPNQYFFQVYVDIYQQVKNIQCINFKLKQGMLYCLTEMKLTTIGLQYKDIINSNNQQLIHICKVKDILAKSLPIASQVLLYNFTYKNFEILLDMLIKFSELTDLPLPINQFLFKNRYKDAIMERQIENTQTTFQELQTLFNCNNFCLSEFDQFDKFLTLKEQLLIITNGSEFLSIIYDQLSEHDIIQIINKYIQVINIIKSISIDEQICILCCMFIIQDKAQLIQIYKQYLPYLRADIATIITEYINRDIKTKYQFYNISILERCNRLQLEIKTINIKEISKIVFQ